MLLPFLGGWCLIASSPFELGLKFNVVPSRLTRIGKIYLHVLSIYGWAFITYTLLYGFFCDAERISPVDY